MANCIGSKNYRFFYWFLVSTSLSTIYVLSFTIVHIVYSFSSDFEFSGRNGAVDIALIIFTFFIMWSLLGLAGYHTFLSCAGLTTREQIKIETGFGEKREIRGRVMRHPFDQGGWKNWLNMCRGANNLRLDNSDMIYTTVNITP